MKRNILSGIILGFLVLLQGCSSHFKSKPISVSQTIEYVADAPLVVKTRNGRVEISADPSMTGISIEAKIACGGKSQEEADERIALASVVAIRNPDQTLLITPDFPGGYQNGDRASIFITVPSSSSVEIYTSNGRVIAHDLEGPITIDTSNGSIELVNHNGPAFLDTSNGRVNVTNQKGDLEIDTSNGSIFISLAPGENGPVVAESSNGSITVHVGKNFSSRVALDTSNGKISVKNHLGIITSYNVYKNHGELVIGEGVSKSRLDTYNGSITIVIGENSKASRK